MDEQDRMMMEDQAQVDPVGQPTTMDDPAVIEKGIEEREQRPLAATGCVEEVKPRGEAPMSDAVVLKMGRDRAEGRLQRGLPMDPDPRSPESDLRASSIAAVAYDAVQRYKEQIGQEPVWWATLEDASLRAEITQNVVKMMNGQSQGASTMHLDWARNMIARGVTPEDDPRVNMVWGQLDHVEARKGLVFAKVVVALLQPV